MGTFYDLIEPMRAQLVEASAKGPVAYVEAEFFGGGGTQSAIVWNERTVLVGPLHTQSHGHEQDGYTTTDDLAIDQALRALGVVATAGGDEFEALGLGRHRHTSAWRPSTREAR